MGPLFAFGKRPVYCVCLLQITSFIALAQTPASTASCQVSASAPQVRAEGLTERLGEIILQCSSSVPGTVFSGNFSISLPVSVTNRVDANNLTRDAIVSVDLGSGFVPTTIAGEVSGNRISFNGVSFTIPANGNIGLKISNVRGAVNQLGYTSPNPIPVTANLSSSLAVDRAQLIIGYSQVSMRSNMSSTGISCVGSSLPATLDMASLFANSTKFASTRVSEGFASAFEARVAGADNGTRFLVKYSDFPAATRLFIPDAVAGSGAFEPTAGGDLSLPRGVGRYVPGSGVLLLVRVTGADSMGAGGVPFALPAGVGPITLGSVSEVALTNGVGYAVYEVAAANPSLSETAQFPTFISLPRFTEPAIAEESVVLGAVSPVVTASETAPVPRFAAVATQSDCTAYGDCGLAPVPKGKLSLEASPFTVTAIAAGGATTAAGSFRIKNIGKGNMDWRIFVVYYGAMDSLVFDPPRGTNDATVRVTANTRFLTAGTWKAMVVVDGGDAGASTVNVTLTVALPAPPPPPPVETPSVVVSKVLNAATLEVAPLVPGSLTTLMGTHLTGKVVTATFDGIPATVLYSGETQINVRVPAELGAKTSATLVVTVDGVTSAPVTIPVGTAWPAVFPHGVLNQDNQENTSSAAAKPGDILQIFATGIPRLATVSVQIGDRKDLVPVYAGEAPTAPGVQQVNVAVPQGVSGALAVLVCASTGGQQYCSPGYAINVQ